MEGSLVLGLADGARLLQQVRLDVGAGDVARGVKVDADEFALVAASSSKEKEHKQKHVNTGHKRNKTR